MYIIIYLQKLINNLQRKNKKILSLMSVFIYDKDMAKLYDQFFRPMKTHM